MPKSENCLLFNMKGAEVKKLHQQLTDLGLSISGAELDQNHFGKTTAISVVEFQKAHQLEPTGIADPLTLAKLAELTAGVKITVSGSAQTEDGLPLGGVKVVAYDKNVGGDEELGSAVTDEAGNFQITYSRDKILARSKEKADLELKIKNPDKSGTVYFTSPIYYSSGSDRAIHLVVPKDPPGRLKIPAKYIKEKESEFAKITTQLRKHAPDCAFKDLQENNTRRDISYLAAKTGLEPGWIAMVSMADRLSKASGVPAECYYALLRAGNMVQASGKGMNLDKVKGAWETNIYKQNSVRVQAVWAKAVAEKIIGESHQSKISKYLEAFQQYQVKYLLDEAGPIGFSTMKEMLQLTLSDRKQQEKLIVLYINHQDSLAEFWEVIQREFGTTTAQQLESDARMGVLTYHNAVLIAKLRAGGYLGTQLVDLIEHGFYQEKAWENLITDDTPIPLEIPGVTPAQKRKNYIEYLVARLKTEFPTAVAGAMVRRDELFIGDTGIKFQIADFLKAEQGSFRIGETSLEPYLKAKQIQMDGAVKEYLKKIQRVYQISPSDETMITLWRNGLDSAYQVVRYGEAEFVKEYGKELGGEKLARRIYAKAHQVHSATLNLAYSYLTYRVNPKTYAISGGTVSGEKSTNTQPVELVQYPKLEELFGAMDYEAGAHEETVLSPAAYLVDLFQFIDLEKFNDRQRTTSNTENPYQVLIRKRPDLQYLELSAANTKTTLPYIDLVNEILEYYVVHRELSGFHGYNSDQTPSEELMANPQHVNQTAYENLAGKVYPMNLPFDLSLETLRRFFEEMGTPLAEAMEKLRVDDRLDPLNLEHYGWRQIYHEYLGISSAESRILTRYAEGSLLDLYGEKPGMSMADFHRNVAEAQAFTRKTGITYQELVAVLRTRFINPGRDLIPTLENLGLSFGELEAMATQLNSSPSIPDVELEKRFHNLATSVRAKYDYQLEKLWTWLRDNYGKISGLILLTASDGAWLGLKFHQLSLRHPLPVKSPGDNQLNAYDYLKLLRFIRLWRKLGYSIPETDSILSGLYKREFIPRGDEPEAEMIDKLNQGFDDVLIPCAQLRKIRATLGLKGSQDLKKSVWLCSDHFTAADFAEYALETGKKLGEIAAGLQAAFQLSVTDIDLIGKEAGFTPETRLLPADLGLIFKYSFLARALKISVAEMITITKLANLNPFGELEPVNPSLIQFIEMINLFRETEIKLQNWSSLFAYVDSSFKEEEILALALEIKEGLARIAGAALNGDASYRGGFTMSASSGESLQERKESFVKQRIGSWFHGFGDRIKIGLEALAVLDDFLTIQASGVSEYSLERPFVDLVKEDLIFDEGGEGYPGGIKAGGGKVKPRLTTVWRFYLTAPERDHYHFRIETQGPNRVQLMINHQDIPLTLLENTQGVQSASPVELMPGKLVPVMLVVTYMSSRTPIEFQWEAGKIPRERIPVQCLTPYEKVAGFRESYLRLWKALTLFKNLDLEPGEIDYFYKCVTYFIAGKPCFRALPVSANGDFGQIQQLFQVVLDLIRYQRLKKSWGADPNGAGIITDILKDPEGQFAGRTSFLFTLTGWEISAVNELLSHFGLTKGELANLRNLIRVQEGMELVKILKVPASSLIQWTTPWPRQAPADLLTGLINALKISYEEPVWSGVYKRINDGLRGRRRDALVSMILHQMKQNPATASIETPDQLFEYFLIDVAVDPVIETSRILQAIIAVQLFIHRSLMNLEPEVSPADIIVKQWEWMKNYRVWEANRKLFLYPENWLEPEFRDNKSPFYQDLESELLQADITAELAQSAFLSYLERLDEVAKLSICGAFLAENENTQTRNDYVLHLIARTPGGTRKYHTRRLEYGNWTPWEKVNLDLGEPVIPVVWKNRLFLFWPGIMKKGGDGGKELIEISLCWSEFFHQKWQPKKTSDPNRPIQLQQVTKDGNVTAEFTLNQFQPQNLNLYAGFGPDGELVIYLLYCNPETVARSPEERRYDFYSDFSVSTFDYFVFQNSPNREPLTRSQLDGDPYHPYADQMLDMENQYSRAIYTQKYPGRAWLKTSYWSRQRNQIYNHTLFGRKIFDFEVAPVSNEEFLDIPAPEIPFFYQDHQQTFLVRPKIKRPDLATPSSIFGFITSDSEIQFQEMGAVKGIKE